MSCFILPPAPRPMPMLGDDSDTFPPTAQEGAVAKLVRAEAVAAV